MPIDVWSNNDVHYYVEFNDLCHPIKKGGHILVKFISMIAKMESYCPVEEKDWHAIDKHFKGKIITDIRDDVKAKVEESRMIHTKMSKQELEDKAFQQTMYCDEIPGRLVGYGLGVKKGDIFGVHVVLRREGYEEVQKRTNMMDCVKEEVNSLHKKMIHYLKKMKS
uniref:Uncharacterized protein n=1 Tax=Chenopodium quinoa TaxID=63459 RepID=A0A803MSC6_CHEQI